MLAPTDCIVAKASSASRRYELYDALSRCDSEFAALHSTSIRPNGPEISKSGVFLPIELRNEFETETRMFVGGSNHKLKLMLTVGAVRYFSLFYLRCVQGGCTYSAQQYRRKQQSPENLMKTDVPLIGAFPPGGNPLCHFFNLRNASPIGCRWSIPAERISPTFGMAASDPARLRLRPPSRGRSNLRRRVFGRPHAPPFRIDHQRIMP